MATLPTIDGPYAAKYPLSRSISYDVAINSFLNGSEQRWLRRGPRGGFTLTYANISATDRDALDTFALATKGQFDSTWSFALPEIVTGAVSTYPTCMFEQDRFFWTENKQFPNRWNGTIKFRQRFEGGQSGPGTIQATFPSVRSGIVTGYPFTYASNYKTEKNDLPSGPRFATAWYAGGFANFPTRGLRDWSLPFNTASDAESLIIEAHYVACGGQWLGFSFTDPKDGTVYPNVRYDMPSLDIRQSAPNFNQFTVKLAEYFV